MPFIASNGLTEADTSKTIQAGGMSVHYHDIGSGKPVLFLHSYGPGTTAWITFHKVVGALSQHFRCQPLIGKLPLLQNNTDHLIAIAVIHSENKPAKRRPHMAKTSSGLSWIFLTEAPNPF